MRPAPLPEADPVIAAAVRKKYRKKPPPLAVSMRDRLGAWLEDGQFADAFGTRGRPGLSPAALSVVLVLQAAEGMTDREAAEAVRTRLDWQYALGLSLDDEGFDFSVLSGFRDRLIAHGKEETAFRALLAKLEDEGLLAAGGKQRTDSTHVLASVRSLHAHELARESVRAALDVLAAAYPDWLAARFCVSDWTRRYDPATSSWTAPRPEGGAGRDEFAIACARDGYALVSACGEDSAPPGARDLPAVAVLRTVLVQNFMISTGDQGQEVISRRRAGDRDSGMPGSRARVASPYDPEARFGKKGDLAWLGYKLHVTDTCDGPRECGCQAGQPARCPHDIRPNIITCVATTDATVTDNAMTLPVTAALAACPAPPARHYADAGYASAANALACARDHGITLVTPLLLNPSRQARENQGYDRDSFTPDYDARTVTCPQGQVTSWWSETFQYGQPRILAEFPAAACRACPARPRCTTASPRHGRTLTLPPRELHELRAAALKEQGTREWRRDYRRRTGCEATMSQADAVAGIRRTPYRGLKKTRLRHVIAATALNLVRLSAYWNGTPLGRTRTSNLARLNQRLQLAA